MKTYFFSVLATALFAGLCEELLPDGGTKSHLRLAAGLCVLAVLVLPAKDAFGGLAEFVKSTDFSAWIPSEEASESYEALFSEAMLRHSSEEAGRHLTSLLCERFGLSTETCRATVTLNANGNAERVLVTLSGSAILTDPHAITAYVNGLLSCPCDVAVA